jgi:uncharacterized protein YqjF (DUF2071 family)
VSIARDFNPPTLQHKFNSRILEQTAHRPWPLPDKPWIMKMTWLDLLFAHWAVDGALLASKVPAPLELDLFDGRAWVGIVPFHMTNVAPRGVPALPWLSAFPELNVRTYVRVGDRPGVYFFSLDAGNPLAVVVARTVFRLPYYSASMRVENTGGAIRYSSRRTSAKTPPPAFVGSYRPTGPVHAPAPGSLEYFLTERYCLYTVDSRSRVFRLEIHHPPWPLQAAEADITVNTMADAAGIRLPPETPLLHFAKRQDMVAWSMASIADEASHPTSSARPPSMTTPDGR